MSDLLFRGVRVLDVATGESVTQDVAVSADRVVEASRVVDPQVLDLPGATLLFGLWDCHAHPGSLMHDPSARGYFEGAPAWAVRAGANLMDAARQGVTGVRAVSEADGVDVAWSRAFAAGEYAGPRLLAAGPGLRTTGGHGTAYPRKPVGVEWEWAVDGADAFLRATRALVERGVDWVKVMLTGGLYSEHESIDDPQLTEAELDAVLTVAHARGVPVAAHCGSARVAETFARRGGRSVEHGYALDERAAAVMAEHGTWLVPTMAVTQDDALMDDDGWPEHAKRRARETAATHAEALMACVAAGVPIAAGADINPIGRRLHDELHFMEVAGMSRLAVLHAATVGGRRLAGLDDRTRPEPGAVADLLVVAGDPREDLAALREPLAVTTYGRLVVSPA
ncbi:amidohydrolase family protein [Nocardioides anomalus]|uniref:Amidohydrolase family protein n=1 Tax=Nocardioides anomalus TaxID=2712223 RepID=A0A6G6W9H3_9ACTN|nr:amidohydrolase family protein [Nocardioides anomalus]QIG42001.1 amidohydrolase family protein [Nocardioides anomalus]